MIDDTFLTRIRGEPCLCRVLCHDPFDYEILNHSGDYYPYKNACSDPDTIYQEYLLKLPQPEEKVNYGLQQPTQHEKRIGPALQRIMKKVEKMFNKETGGDVDIIIVVNSSAARRQQSAGAGVPVGMYVANMDRTSSALTMAEMLAKWQLLGNIKPLNELEDAAGNRLSDIMSAFNIDDPDINDSNDTEGGVH